MNPADGIHRSAVVSESGLYRYHLTRRWEGDLALSRMTFVMLNPSTADAEKDDRTIRRCMGFAKREGCGSIAVINLFALRCTKPVHLLDHPDPEGPLNRLHWSRALQERRGPVVAAWGAYAWKLENTTGIFSWAKVLTDMWGWLCLGTTKEGAPRHPLYLPAETPLEPFYADHPRSRAVGA